MLSWTITILWLFLLNCYVIPLLLYGPSLIGNFDSLYGLQVLVSIILGILVSPLTDLN